MLAPRKKLWSSPPEAIKTAIQLLDPGPDDVVFDIGCGDGRFIIECAKRTKATVVGIEVNEKRCQEITKKIELEKLQTQCSVICGNALEVDMSKVC